MARGKIDGNFDTALKHCNEEIEISYDCAKEKSKAYNFRGNVFRRMGQYEKALEDYEKAMVFDEFNGMAHVNKERVYYDLRNYDEAIKYYDKALDISSKLTAPHYNKGLIYFNNEEYEEAIDCYKKVYALYKDKNRKTGIKHRIQNVKELLRIKNMPHEEKDISMTVIEKTKELFKKTEANKVIQNKFHSHRNKVIHVDGLELLVLRKWNSYTPIASSGVSKGGGYFIKYANKGIVVDPGFDFIKNFVRAGYTVKDIDAVFFTHAHNDHTADLESLLTLHYKYNDDLYGSDSEEKPRSIYDAILDRETTFREGLSSDRKEAIEKKVKEEFEKRRKCIKFYMTAGTHKKYANFFNLEKSSNYKVVCVDDEENNKFKISGTKLEVHVIKAQHNDVISDCCSVGFCFKLKDFALVYTGDTGFEDISIKNAYKKLKARHINEKKHITLLANLGGCKDSEKYYSINNIKRNKECYYKEHLGRIGLTKITEILRPEVCIISEFGEEFDGYRIDVTKMFDEAFKSKKDIGSEIVFLPADIGFCLKFHNNKIKVRAITDHIPKEKPNELTDRDGFACEFVEPHEVCLGEVYQVSQLYYFKEGVDPTALAQRKTSKFYDTIIPAPVI